MPASIELLRGYNKANYIGQSPITGLKAWSFDEGDDIQVSVSTYNFSGRKVYIKITGAKITASDFSPSTVYESIVGLSGQASVLFNVRKDEISEGAEIALISVYGDQDYTQLLGAANAYINDTSKAPIVATNISLKEGDDFLEGATLIAGSISGDSDAKIVFYQWFKDGEPIPTALGRGSTVSSFKTSLTGSGAYKVQLTIQNSDGYNRYLTSGVQVILKYNNGNGTVGAITSSVSGSFVEGVTLFAPSVTLDPDGDSAAPGWSYQWYRNGTVLENETSAACLIPAAGAGIYKVAITYFDAQGFRATVESANQVVTGAPNSSPTNITPSITAFNENIAAGSVVTTLSTLDPDAGNTFVYSLVTGDGSADNAAFLLNRDQISIKASPDFEKKSSYRLRVRSTDQGGLFFEKSLVFTVNNVVEKVTASASTALAPDKDTLELVGSRNIWGTGNGSNNTIIGNSGANRLTGRLGKDVLTGLSGSDSFVYASLSDSLLAAYDVITDYAAGEKIVALFDFEGGDITSSAGGIAALQTAAISSLLTSDRFEPYSALVFTVKDMAGTFLALNNFQAGFQESSDAIIHLQNYSVSAAAPVSII